MNVIREIADGAEVLARLPSVAAFALIGSAAYLPNPADVDFAVLLNLPASVSSGDYFDDHLKPLGFRACSGEYGAMGDGDWYAVRRGNLNLMVSTSETFYGGYIKAIEVCKLLNLTDKQDRIDVCQIVRDGLPASSIRMEVFTRIETLRGTQA